MLKQFFAKLWTCTVGSYGPAFFVYKAVRALAYKNDGIICLFHLIAEGQAYPVEILYESAYCDFVRESGRTDIFAGKLCDRGSQALFLKAAVRPSQFFQKVQAAFLHPEYIVCMMGDPHLVCFVVTDCALVFHGISFPPQVLFAVLYAVLYHSFLI